MLDTYLKWFQAHERMVMAIVILSFSVWGLNHWVDKSVETAKIQATISHQQSIEQVQANALLQVQIQKQQDAFNQVLTANQAEMKSLALMVVSRDAASTKQVAQVSGPKTPPQAVTDLNAVYPTLPTPLVPTDSGASVPTADLQVFTVTKIEGDTAKADLADTRTELKDSQSSLTQAVSLLKGKDDQISGLNLSLAKNDKACADDKTQLKADARKHSWKWFWAGVTAGFVGRGLVKL